MINTVNSKIMLLEITDDNPFHLSLDNQHSIFCMKPSKYFSPILHVKLIKSNFSSSKLNISSTHEMVIRQAVENIRSSKCTSDFIHNPVFLLENTDSLDKETHYELILQKVHESENHLLMCHIKSKLFSFRQERMHLNTQKEKRYNLLITREIKNLLKIRWKKNQELNFIFNIIIDYHIKYNYIDKYNKNELLFVLLPHFQEYENEIKKLGINSSLSAIVRQMKNRKFFINFLEYSEYSPSFFEKAIKQFLKCNIQLHPFFYSTILKMIQDKKIENRLESHILSELSSRNVRV